MNFPVPQSESLPAQYNEEAFKKLAGADKYIGYLSLLQSNADLAKPPHKLPQGNWVLVENQEPTLLGERFSGVAVAWRPTARIVDKRGNDTKIVSYHDPESPQFKEIQVKSEGQQDATYVHYFGFEFLIWIDSIQKFATFYANGKTSRRAAREQLWPLLSTNGNVKLVEFSGTFIEKGTYSWYGPIFRLLEDQEPENTPKQEEMEQVYTRFTTAKGGVEGSEEEVTDQEEADDER